MSGPHHPHPEQQPGAQPSPMPGYTENKPPQGSPPPPGSYGAPADVGIRLGARVIDWLIVAIPMNIVYTVLFWVAPWFIALAVGFVLSFAAFAYFVYFETQQGGATVAKKLLKLKVVGAQGGIPTIDESAKRNIWMLVGVLAWLPVFFLPLFLGFIWIGLALSIAITINSDPRNQGWHDKFAGGTSVVKTA